MSIKRNRAWRRFRNNINNGKGMGCLQECKPEKNWKHLYTRSTKVARAKQLGFEYPRMSPMGLVVEDIYENQ